MLSSGQIINSWVAEHFEVNFIDVEEFLDTFRINLFEVLEADGLLRVLALLVSPGEAADVHIKIRGLDNVLHILLDGLECTDHIEPK